MNRVNIIAVVLGVVNLVVAGPPVMRTVPTDTENVQESGLVALGAEDTALGSSTNRYIMWNKYSAGTSTCNLHDSGQKLDVKRIPHGCSGVAVSSPRLRAPHRFFILFLSSSSSSSSFLFFFSPPLLFIYALVCCLYGVARSMVAVGLRPYFRSRLKTG